MLLGLVERRRAGVVPFHHFGRLELAPVPNRRKVAPWRSVEVPTMSCGFQTFMLLRDVGIDRVRKCPECVSIFIATGKRDYCNPKCQNRHNQREYRKRQFGRQDS